MEAARAQIEALEAHAKSKDRASFRFQLTGQWRWTATVCSGREPRAATQAAALLLLSVLFTPTSVDPHQRCSVGQVTDKGWGWSSPPGSSIEDSKSPLKVKLTKQKQADVAHLRGQHRGWNAGRQQAPRCSDKEGNTYNPYDHVSLLSLRHSSVQALLVPRRNEGTRARQHLSRTTRRLRLRRPRYRRCCRPAG